MKHSLLNITCSIFLYIRYLLIYCTYLIILKFRKVQERIKLKKTKKFKIIRKLPEYADHLHTVL